MVKIHVNDETIQLPAAIPLQQFLIDWQKTAANDNPNATFAVALNGEFVPRTQYSVVILKNGDALDIVSPVGGG
jgi:sulfur carrier protein